MNIEYEQFKQEREKEEFFAMKEAQAVADKAYNKGLWDAVKWRNPAAYYFLRRGNGGAT